MGRDLAVGVVGCAIAAAMAADLTVVSLFAATFSVDQRPLLIGAGAAGRLTAAATFSTSQHDHLSRRRGSIGSRCAHRRNAPRCRRLPSGVPPGLLPCTGYSRARASPTTWLRSSSVRDPYCASRDLPCMRALPCGVFFCSGAPAASVPRLSRPCSASPFSLLSSPTSTPPVKPSADPCPAGPVALPFITFVGFVAATAFPAGFTVAATFPARSVVPLAGSLSSRLDTSLSWPSRPNPPLPLLFYRVHGYHDRRRRVRCHRPPWQGFLMSG
jgi:hypothetical protein